MKEEVHGAVSLECSKTQIASFGLEGNWIGHNGAHAKASIEFTEFDVPVLAHVDIEEAVELQALQVTNEVGWSRGGKAPFGQDSGLDVTELQSCVVPIHLTCERRVGGLGKVIIKCWIDALHGAVAEKLF